MSFETGGVPSYNPKIQSTFFNQNGGGGNTGYFQQEQKELIEEKPQEDKLELSSQSAESNEDIAVSLKDFKFLYKFINFLRAKIKAFLLSLEVKVQSDKKTSDIDSFLKTEVK